MHARVVTTAVAPDKVDAVIRLWMGSVAPSARQQPGFRNARLLVDRDSGAVLSMGIWETEADFQNSVVWNREQVAQFAELFTAAPQVAHYELVAEI